ncbi:MULTISPECIES: hypothetical protein [unclassified Haladaptatus]|uniref:hypothetical protein n=1 Tax=unclassified Haladaptatus TaxID=2622732 RepID=UPI0023E82F1C|nr:MULTISPECIES: hypothetical protein [unclassified Haladaptatus]
MAKVSIGVRGWRFEEDEVFDEEGNLKPLADMPVETRRQVLRLTEIVGSPCDACWLIHGDEDIRRCRITQVVYGEPLGEVLLCNHHEADFLYWWREEGGNEHAGHLDMDDYFHEWFLDGGRAPEGYGPDEHVDTDPDSVPKSPRDDQQLPSLEEELGVESIDELDFDSVDFGQDYPRK